MHTHDSRPFQAFSSANQIDSFVIPPKEHRRIVIQSLDAEGGTAGDLVQFQSLFNTDKTTVQTAAAAAATAIQLVGDDDGNLQGVAVTTSDFVVVATNAGWQVLDIAAVSADAGNDRVDITSMTALDGGSGLIGAVEVGALAYVVRAANIVTLATIGTGSLNREDNPFAGEYGNPLVVLIDSQGANAHSVSGTFTYSEVS